MMESVLEVKFVKPFWTVSYIEMGGNRMVIGSVETLIQLARECDGTMCNGFEKCDGFGVRSGS